MKVKVFISAILLVIAFTSLRVTNITGREIMQKVKDRPDGDTRYATMKMTLIKKNGKKRERKIVSWAMDIGNDTKKVMFFTYPGDVKGTGFLIWDYDDINKENDKWLYLPAMKKTRRISGKSSKTDYFMGSDFTYDDMGSRNVDEDKHTFLREEMLDGHKCWVVESIAIDRREIYSKKISWIRQDCNMCVKVDYYDKLNKLHRCFSISEIIQIQGFWTTHRMEMVNVQTGHKTVLDINGQKFNQKVESNLFTVARLERGL